MSMNVTRFKDVFNVAVSVTPSALSTHLKWVVFKLVW